MSQAIDTDMRWLEQVPPYGGCHGSTELVCNYSCQQQLRDCSDVRWQTTTARDTGLTLTLTLTLHRD
jgi:hypothetical protein